MQFIKNDHDKDVLDKLRSHLIELGKYNDGSSATDCGLIYHNLGDQEESIKYFKKSEKIYSNLVPSVETLRQMNNKQPIETFIKHEFEQIRHIDSDADGIRNMKITQELYNNLEELSLKKSDDFTDDDYKFICDLHKIKYNKPPKTRDFYINQNLAFDEIEKNIAHLILKSL